MCARWASFGHAREFGFGLGWCFQRHSTTIVSLHPHYTMKGSVRLIGSSEFCAHLNNDGTSPTTIYLALKRFAWTARKQRLSSTKDDNSGSSGDEDGDSEDDIDTAGDEQQEYTSEPPKKKYRKDESWKEDTSSYNVPFVGTNVAVTLDPVVTGEWPTGLLKAYLEKSPLAVELTSDTFFPGSRLYTRLSRKSVEKKQRQLPRSLLKAFLRCLSELAQAADKDSRFVIPLVKHRLGDIGKLLRQQEHINLVLPILRGLANAAPREVARTLESILDGRLSKALAKEDRYWELITRLMDRDDPVIRSCLVSPLKFALQNMNQSRPLKFLETLATRIEAYRNSISSIITKDGLQNLQRMAIDTYSSKGIDLLMKLVASDSPLWRTHKPVLVRSLAYLIDNGNPSFMSLVIATIRSNPSLDKTVMDSFSVLPDPSKASLQYCSKARKLVHMIRSFPSVALKHPGKQTLAKGLQSKNALVVYQTLLLLTELLKGMDSAASQDMSLVVTVLSQLKVEEKKSDMVLSAFGCNLVGQYMSVVGKNCDLDWSKALVGKGFGRFPIALQRMVLKASRACLVSFDPPPPIALSAFERIFRMFSESKNTEIINPLRNVACELLVFASGCTRFESSRWIDRLGLDTLNEFVEHVQKSQTQLPVVVAVAQAWVEAGLLGSPRNEDLPSPLLCYALQSGQLLDALVAHVASNCLLQTTRPLGLAALLTSSLSKVSDTDAFEKLRKYSVQLVSMARGTIQPCESIFSLATQLLDSRSVLDTLFSRSIECAPESTIMHFHDYDGLSRQVAHLALVASSSQRETCSRLLPSILPLEYSVSARQRSTKLSGLVLNLLPILLTNKQLDVNEVLKLLANDPKSACIEEVSKTRTAGPADYNLLIVPESLHPTQAAILLSRFFSVFLKQGDTFVVASVPKLVYAIGLLTNRMDFTEIPVKVLAECVRLSLAVFLKVAPDARSRDHQQLLALLEKFTVRALEMRNEVLFITNNFQASNLIESILLYSQHVCVGLEQNERSLLDVLIQQYGSHFSSLVLHSQFSMTIEGQCQEFPLQYLDRAMCFAIQRLDDKHATCDLQINTLKLIGSRCKLILASDKNFQMSLWFFKMLGAFLDSRLRPELHLHDDLAEFLVTVLKKFDEPYLLAQLPLASAIIDICSDECGSNNSLTGLRLHVTASLAKSLPCAIRLLINTPTSTQFRDSFEEVATLIARAFRSFSFLHTDFHLLVDSVSSLVRVCLKYGLRSFQIESHGSLANLCFDIVESVIVGFQSNKIPKDSFLNAFQLSFESWLFALLTSHSKFRYHICNNESGKQATQLKVFEILLLCKSNESGQCQLDEDHLSVILDLFEGSMSRRDLLIRMIFQSFASKVNHSFCTILFLKPSLRHASGISGVNKTPRRVSFSMKNWSSIEF